MIPKDHFAGAFKQYCEIWSMDDDTLRQFDNNMRRMHEKGLFHPNAPVCAF